MEKKKNIKSIFWHILHYGYRFLPNCRLKHKLCLGILAQRNSLPLYLAVYPGNVAVQVGTPNISTVRKFSRLVGAGGQVYVIEADPVNADKLLWSVEKFGIENVKVIKSGAWSSKGTLTLRKSDDFDGDHKIEIPDIYIDNDFRTEYKDAVQIEVDTVDNLLFSLDVKAINYLSVTVNGAEHEVLKGCQGILDKSEHIRVYSKGHARIGSAANGVPINKGIASLLESRGFIAVLTHGEKSTANIEQWQSREGDVFGWKTKTGYIC